MNAQRKCHNTHTKIGLSHKENEILSFAGKRIEREDIMLSEISQKQKDKCNIYT
jgi:hypothetical protein